MDSKVQQFLIDLYQPLIGHVFEAMYNGEFNMPYTGKERTILQIRPENPFAAELQRISKHVQARDDGESIWKGITGPPDYDTYWLWVEPEISRYLEEGSTYSFKISRCEPFPCNGPHFTHGVSIQVAQEVEPKSENAEA